MNIDRRSFAQELMSWGNAARQFDVAIHPSA